MNVQTTTDGSSTTFTVTYEHGGLTYKVQCKLQAFNLSGVTSETVIFFFDDIVVTVYRGDDAIVTSTSIKEFGYEGDVSLVEKDGEYFVVIESEECVVGDLYGMFAAGKFVAGKYKGRGAVTPYDGAQIKVSDKWVVKRKDGIHHVLLMGPMEYRGTAMKDDEGNIFPHGYGVVEQVTMPDGSWITSSSVNIQRVYEGCFYMGRRHGKGTLGGMPVEYLSDILEKVGDVKDVDELEGYESLSHVYASETLDSVFYGVRIPDLDKVSGAIFQHLQQQCPRMNK